MSGGTATLGRPLRLPELESELVGIYPSTQIVRCAGRRMDATLYILTIEVPHFGEAHLTIRVGLAGGASEPRVFVADPRRWEHGNGDGSLCLWAPFDEEDHRWLPADGLAALVEIARAHLYKEARLLETGEWAGEEARHTPSLLRQMIKSRRSR